MLTTSEFRDKYNVARDTFFKYRKEVESTLGRTIGVRKGNSIQLTDDEVGLLLEAIPSHLQSQPEDEPVEQLSIVKAEPLEMERFVPEVGIQVYEFEDNSDTLDLFLEDLLVQDDTYFANRSALNNAELKRAALRGQEKALQEIEVERAAYLRTREIADLRMAEKVGIKV